MALSDHFRELRARTMRVAIYLVGGTIVAMFFWQSLFNLIYEPYRQAAETLGNDVNTHAVINSVGGPLMLQLKISGIAGIIATSPLWLWEIWGFLSPGLHPQEKRWTRIFVCIAGPLFLMGVVVGYYVLPKGIQVLLGFTPSDITSLVDFNEYFSFVTRMLLVFGIAFEIPVFVVLLNLAGIVKGSTLAKHRPMIIIGTFVFAAVATPSTDPFSMLMLGVPMLALFIIAEIIARSSDRMRGREQHSTDQWGDDEISPI